MVANDPEEKCQPRPTYVGFLGRKRKRFAHSEAFHPDPVRTFVRPKSRRKTTS